MEEAPGRVSVRQELNMKPRTHADGATRDREARHEAELREAHERIAELEAELADALERAEYAESALEDFELDIPDADEDSGEEPKEDQGDRS